MIENKKISLVIPAYNEEKMIAEVITSTPHFVDKIIVVDDNSNDATATITTELQQSDDRITLLRHQTNGGVGAAIISGYKYSKENNFDITAVVAGDGQMDPKELIKLCEPLVYESVDYAKGNRLVHEDAWKAMPRYRFIGNSILSLLTKISSGYWFLTDTQTGYTAISLHALKSLNLDTIYKNYGFPNDILVKLNVINAKIKEIPIKPIYYKDGKSGIRLHKVIPKISYLLFKNFFWRMKEKYVIRDFHPLVFFYFLSFFLFIIDIGLIIRLLVILFDTGRLAPMNMLSIIFVSITGLQFLLFAMWFDMDYNRHLKIE